MVSYMILVKLKLNPDHMVTLLYSIQTQTKNCRAAYRFSYMENGSGFGA